MIYTCQSAGGAQNAFTHATPSPGLGSWSDCAPNDSEGAVKVLAGIAPGAVGPFANAQATMTAQAGTHFASAVLSYDAYSDTTAGWNAWLAASNDGSFSGNWGSSSRRWLDGCTAGSFCAAMSVHNRFFDINGAHAVQLMAICGSLSCITNTTGVPPYYARAFVYLKGGQFSIVDDTDPAVTGVGVDDQWHRGNVSFPLAADDNTGIKRAYALVDGGYAWSADYQGSCSYTRPSPCQHDRHDTISAPAPATDGDHTLQVAVDDAAGRRGYSQAYHFKTDNTAPARPESIYVDYGEGWNTSNGRVVHWRVPDQGAGAPVTEERVRLCNDDTAKCSEWDTAQPDPSTVTLSVGDEPGDYTVRVALRDAAGNLGAFSDAVHLRYDDRAPGDALPRNANGWLNAEERAAYQQHVELIDGALRAEVRESRATR